MTEQQGEWYDDPTNRYMHRYWNGAQWVDQASSGTTNGTDPTPMDTSAAGQAAAPTVQVMHKCGMGFGAVIGMIPVIAEIVMVVLVLTNNSGDDSSTPTTAAPTTTEAPATAKAPLSERNAAHSNTSIRGCGKQCSREWN